MEIVKLLELDIDAEALIKKAADARQALDGLKTNVKTLEKALEDGEADIQLYQNKLASLKERGDENSSMYKNYEKSLQELNISQELNRKKLEETSSSLRKAEAEYTSLQNQVDAYNKIQKDSLGFITKTDGSYDQLKVALENNKKVYKELNTEQQNNKDIGGKLLATINSQQSKLNDLQGTLDGTKQKYTSFWEALKSGFQLSTDFGSMLEKEVTILPEIGAKLNISAKGLQDYSKQQWAAALATEGTSRATKIFKAALVSTGIGAIVAALGLLVSALSQSQQFTDTFSKALAPIQGIFKGIILVLQDLAGIIIDIAKGYFGQWKDNFIILKNEFLNGIDVMRFAWAKFTGNEEDMKEIQGNMIARQEEINAAVERTAGRFKAVVDGIKGAGDKFNEYSEKIKKAAENEARIVELKKQQEETENKLIITRSKLNSKINEQKKIADDVTKSEEERKAAAQASYDLATQLLEEEKKLLAIKIEKKILEIENNGENREAQAELNELKAKENELNDQGITLLEDKSKSIKSIIESEKNKRIAAWDAAIKKSEEALDLYIAQENGKQKSLQQTLDFEKNVYDKKKAILEQQLNAGKISQTKYETDILNLKNDYLQKTAMATVDNLTSEMELYVAQHQSKIDSETQLTNELVKEEENRLATIYDKKSAILKTQRDNDLISEKDFLLQKIELDKEYEDQKEALSKQYKEQQKAEKVAKIKEEYEEKIANEANQWEVQRLQAEERYALENEDLLNKYEKGKITKEEYIAYEEESEQRKADDIKKINEAEFNNKLNLAKDTLSNITSLLGEHTAAGKAAAIAQTTIDTYQSAVAAYKSLAEIPVVGPAMGAVAAAAAISSGIANVKKITSVKTPKAEHGAVFTIGGNRHSNGGTKFYGEDGTTFEAEQGEKMFVLNRRASAAMAPLLSGINQRFGGVSLASASGYLAAGGQVLRNSAGVAGTNNLKIDYDLLANRIGQSVSAANSQLPPPVVAVTDINYGQSSYARVVNGASI